MSANRNVVLVALAIAGVVDPALGTSARSVHAELVEVRQVALNLSLTVLPEMNSAALERAIRDRLVAAGMGLEESAQSSLFVHTEQLDVPGRDDLLVVRTEIAVSEEARISRPGKDLSAWVDIYSTDESFVVSRSEAWSTAERSLLRMLETLIDSRSYAASVKARRR